MGEQFPLVSIIVPVYNHAQFLPDAIRSVLDQTWPNCELIIVDDGSDDDSLRIARNFRREFNRSNIAVLPRRHAGPSVARNEGIEVATGHFVMFLDADDVIAPTKIEDQVAAFTPEIGWVLCDVRIEDEAKGTTENASVKYAYHQKELGGWIQPLLTAGPFIPIMSPLVRRSVLGQSIRFDDRLVPEDYHFWRVVSGVARVAYVPKVLATYRHRREGRSRLPKTSRVVVPNVQAPLRLNLGCGTPDTRSWHPMPGMVNLDRSLGWRFEDGLGEFVDHSVAGITISHALMYVPLAAWPAVFADFARVLADGGVIRITEDDTADPTSGRLGGWRGSEPAVTLTSWDLVRTHLSRVGLTPSRVTANESRFVDRSLCQAQHGDPPDVFFIEGVRESGVVFAPHNDDEALWAAFTILRYRPRVVVCFPSARDYGDSAVREQETRDAMAVLGASDVEQWHGGDLVQQMRAFDARVHPVRVWAPDVCTSHPDHLAVAEAAAEVFGARVTTYHTYRDGQKVTSDRRVDFEPLWVGQKLRALARYETQIAHPRANQFFAMDLHEYYGESHAS